MQAEYKCECCGEEFDELYQVDDEFYCPFCESEEWDINYYE